MKVKVRSPDGDTQTSLTFCCQCSTKGYTLAPNPFIIYLNYVLWTSIDLMKENSFTLEKASRWHPAQTITGADYADNIAILTNTPTQAESLLHSLERIAGGIGIQMNTNKTEYMWFNQRVDISTLNTGSLKQVDKFTYSGSSVSSTKITSIRD